MGVAVESRCAGAGRNAGETLGSPAETLRSVYEVSSSPV
jgi:hypothetical protein